MATAETQDILTADASIQKLYGMSVERLEEGVCDFSAVVSEDLINARGFAHGSLCFALLDTAAAYALIEQGAGGVTISANMTYIRGTHAGDRLRGFVRVAHAGRRVASAQGEVSVEVDGAWKLAAQGTFTFQVMPR